MSRYFIAFVRVKLASSQQFLLDALRILGLAVAHFAFKKLLETQL